MSCRIRIGSSVLFMLLTFVAVQLAAIIEGGWAGLFMGGIVMMIALKPHRPGSTKELAIVCAVGFALSLIFWALAIPDGFTWALAIWLLALVFLHRR